MRSGLMILITSLYHLREFHLMQPRCHVNLVKWWNICSGSKCWTCSVTEEASSVIQSEFRSGVLCEVLTEKSVLLCSDLSCGEYAKPGREAAAVCLSTSWLSCRQGPCIDRLMKLCFCGKNYHTLTDCVAVMSSSHRVLQRGFTSSWNCLQGLS